MATTTETDQAALAERANKGDKAAQWDLAIAHAATNSTSATAEHCHALELHPAKRHLFPQLDRDLTRIDTGLRDTMRAVALGEQPWPLFIHGTAGGGKTLAALCLADVLDTACYFDPESLADAVMSKDRGPAQQAWDAIRTTELAILDELGARQNIGDLGYSTVKRFCDLREMNAGRVAIYISNLPPAQLAKTYDDRIGSRILGGTIYHLQADDRRRAEAMPSASLEGQRKG